MILVEVEHEETADAGFAALAARRLVLARHCEDNLLGEAALGLDAIGTADLSTEVAVFRLGADI